MTPPPGPRPPGARRNGWLRSPIVTPVVAAAWVVLAAWSLRYVLSVIELRDGYRTATDWVHSAEEVRELLVVASSAPERRPRDYALGIEDVLLPALEDPDFTSSAPCAPEIRAVADRAWRPSAQLIVEVLAKDRRAVIDPAVADRAAGALASVIHDVRVTAQELSSEQNEAFATLYALTGVLLACGAGLATLCVRYRDRSVELDAARAAALEGQRHLESLVQTAQDLIWATDPDGRLTFVNSTAAALYGVPVSSMLGRRWPEFSEAETVDHDARAFSELLRSDEPVEVETVHRAADGRKIHLRFRGRALRDGAGRALGATGTAADVTRLHEMQQRHLHAERIQAIGTLAGGIAHDFNNLLTAIVGYCELARFDLDDRAACGRDLEELERVALRGRSLTDQLLQFARKQPMRRSARDLRDVLQGVERLTRRVMPEDIELRFELPDTPVHARVDRGRLEHVLLNLAVNARDAVGSHGHITFRLETSRAEAGDEHCPMAHISVRDDGTGMDAETLRQVFDPYFTTKPLGEGTGLGLSIAQGIVAQHDGALRIRSTLGEGTVVSILLPTVESRTSEESWDTGPVLLGAPLSTRESQRLLLVEDDPSVLHVLSVGLRSAGFQVDTPESAVTALRLVEFGDLPYDALVTDVRMPGASGPEIAEAARAAHPDLPVVFLSGYGGDILDAAWLERPRVAFVEKPFPMEKLISVLDELLVTVPA